MRPRERFRKPDGFGTTVDDLLAWFAEGEAKGNDWMLIVSNLYSGREFPVYVSPNRSLPHTRRMWSGKWHKVVAVYDLGKPFSQQSDSFRTSRMTSGRKI